VWPFGNAMKAEEIQLIEDLTTRFETVPQGPWADAPKLAAVVPIRSNVVHQLAGFALLELARASNLMRVTVLFSIWSLTRSRSVLRTLALTKRKGGVPRPWPRLIAPRRRFSAT
jgi:hypothetical protein